MIWEAQMYRSVSLGKTRSEVIGMETKPASKRQLAYIRRLQAVVGEAEPEIPQVPREGAYDSLHEVLNMKPAQNVGCEVDSWISEENLPASAQLKVIRQNDPDYGLTEDELAERNEFIHWYLLQDYAPLLLVPRQTDDAGFFIPEVDVTSPECSAFSTHDFLDSLQPFNKYGYAMKKLMERIRDLTILHSCLSSEQGRLNTQRGFEALSNHFDLLPPLDPKL
jgi:hypothetical protein